MPLARVHGSSPSLTRCCWLEASDLAEHSLADSSVSCLGNDGRVAGALCSNCQQHGPSLRRERCGYRAVVQDELA